MHSMKPPAFVLISLSLLLQSCEALPIHPRSTTNQTTALASPVTSRLAGDDDALGEVPLPVGYAFNGGWFELYFTDPANPAAKQLSGGPDGPLAAAIDSAQLSVDAALYSLSLYSIRQALVHAHRRGVQVRIVMESDNMDGSDSQALKDAEIPILGDRREGLMHNKFLVIDRSEVWTGSMNLTKAGAYSDRNSIMRIRSTKVAADYEAEFNEMFVNDKFGSAGADATPNPRVILDDTPLDIYFSPDDHAQAALLDLLNNASSSIYFLAFSFTADPLSNAIQQRAQVGVTVSGVMDAGQVRTNTGTEYDAFRTAGIDVRLDAEPGLMHHKVLIIDAQTVVMGSYNFTASAEKTNDENLIVIYSPEIAAQYLQEFRRVYASAGP